LKDPRRRGIFGTFNRNEKGGLMKIGPLENGPIGPRLGDQRRQTGEKPAPEEKSDRIDISPEARAKLAARELQGDSVRRPSVAHTPGDVLPSAVDNTRLDLARCRIKSGFYDQEDVKLLMADRLADEMLTG
jgi:hypothetical protein